MGRKANNKKKARAARPAAQSTPVTTTTIPSLKGILSTNDDPYRCHGCSNNFDFNELMLGAHDWTRTSICCGKMFCCDCAEAGKCQSATGVACSSCGVSTTRKLSKARAKKGHPWAQFALAWQLRDESPLEARKLHRKAAEEGGHPFAFVRLAELHRYGQWFNRTKIMGFLGEAMEIFLSSELMFDFSVTLHVANEVCIGSNFKDSVEFVQHALLVPLANKGLRGAQYQLSVAIVYLEKDFSVALDLARKAAVQAGAPPLSPGAPARLAVDCCRKLNRTVERLFWAKQAALADGHRKDLAKTAHFELCEMRKSCSVCGISLNSSSRKLCKSCKICCYCSRECQRVHWNQPDDGHRDECKAIMELVEEIKDEKTKE